MSNVELDDLALLTPDLASLGWNHELDDWIGEVAADLGVGADALIPGRLARVSSGFSVVFTGGDAVLAASGRDRAALDVVPATGDFVAVASASASASDSPADDETDLAIVAVAERRSALSRRASGRVPEPQILAANADAVFVMDGLDRDLNLRRLERQLVIAWDSGAEPVVVLTKADVVDDVGAAVAEVEAIAPGAAVLAVSTTAGDGLEAVHRYFDGHRTVALMGLSGIGKSTLVNALSGGRVQRTGEVRASDGRGRHTTVTRDLVPLPDGGFVIDAPGVREIGLWQTYEGLDLAFPEIAEAAQRCRFGDCEHESEPGCEVRPAVVSGVIPQRRLDHWRELSAELELQERQLVDFARRAESRDRADAEERRDDTRGSRRGGGRGGGRGRRR